MCSRTTCSRGGRGRRAEPEAHEDNDDNEDESAGHGADDDRERHVENVGGRAFTSAYETAEQLHEHAAACRCTPRHAERPAYHHLSITSSHPIG